MGNDHCSAECETEHSVGMKLWGVGFRGEYHLNDNQESDMQRTEMIRPFRQKNARTL